MAGLFHLGFDGRFAEDSQSRDPILKQAKAEYAKLQ